MRSIIKTFWHKLSGLSRLQRDIQQELVAIRTLLEGQNPSTPLLNQIDERLNHYFRWRMPVHFTENGRLLIHTNDGHRLYVDTKEPFMTLHLLEHGEWETPVRRELRNLLKPGATLVDVGANIGLHTLFASMLIGSSGTIVALEPHPVTGELLRQNLEINGLLDLVKILPLAVSDSDDATMSFEYFVEHPAMSGLKVSQNILERFKGQVETIQVKTITIDTLVERHELKPDFIKIDVEGFEANLLQGCERTIAANSQVAFLMEYEKEMAEAVIRPGIGSQIAAFFDRHGFSMFRIDEQGLTPISPDGFCDEIRGDYVMRREPADGE